MQNLDYVKIKIGNGSQQVEAIAIICGTDVSVSFGGGSAYHIGASALASPRASHLDSTKGSASASVICVFGHMEDTLCREAALQLSTALNTVVNVTVGLHIDNATSEDMKALIDNFYLGVEAVKKLIQEEMSKAGVPIRPLDNSYRASGPVGPKK